MWFKKKSYLEGVFEFLHPDPQLDQNFKPTRNLCGQLLTIYKYIYTWSIYPQSIKKIEGHFWYSVPPNPTPSNKTFPRKKKGHRSSVILKVSKSFPNTNSGCRPRCVNAELDPEGRGKELVGKGLTTHKNQIRIQFYKWNPFKKSSPKNWNRLQIYMKNPLEIYRTSKKNLKEFPLKWIPCKVYRWFLL